MRPLALCAALLLSACALPAARFHDAEPIPVTVPPFTFEVRVLGARAEALLQGRDPAPEAGLLARRAAVAIEWASGCRIQPSGLRADRRRVTAALLCLSAQEATTAP
jgi:hypothetical protein